MTIINEDNLNNKEDTFCTNDIKINDDILTNDYINSQNIIQYNCKGKIYDENDNDMDMVRILPVEVVEEIFKHLNVKDLINCSYVSLNWREAANNDKLWFKLWCLKYYDLNKRNYLLEIESSFINKKYQFNIPSNLNNDDERLIPVCNWKVYYCQQNYLMYNWRRGRYATHWVGNKDVIAPFKLSYDSEEPNKIFLPLIKHNDNTRDLIVIKVDGKPKNVCTLERDINDFNFVCNVCYNTIAYIIDTRLKIVQCNNINDDITFKTISILNIRPVNNELNTNTLEVIQRISLNRLENQQLLDDTSVTPKTNYFILLSKDYIISGEEDLYFNIWCRKTFEKKGLIQLQFPNSTISLTLLHCNYIYFVSFNNNAKHYVLFEYYITKNVLKQIITSKNRILKIIVNDNNLVVVTTIDPGRNLNDIVVYKRCNYNNNAYNDNDYDNEYHIKKLYSIVHDTSENWNLIIPQILLSNDLMFYLQGTLIKIIGIDNPQIRSEFSVGTYGSHMYTLHDNLLMFRTRGELEIWDWEKGIRLHTPCVELHEGVRIFYDRTRIILLYPPHKGEMCIIGYW